MLFEIALLFVIYLTFLSEVVYNAHYIVLLYPLHVFIIVCELFGNEDQQERQLATSPHVAGLESGKA